MGSQPIDRAIAKRELARINAVLRSPRLLIGGLAVQQYYAPRVSRDIDLVCDFQTAHLLLNTLYPSSDWKVIDKQNDEYRPSFQITHKVEDFGAIIFGPKISEREPYAYIDWDRLATNAKPFLGPSGLLENILVPSAHALAYTKFVSFLGRHAPDAKVRTDLQDLVDLSNSEEFSVSLFFDLLRMSKAFHELARLFRHKASRFSGIVEASCLSGIAGTFITPLQLVAISAERPELPRPRIEAPAQVPSVVRVASAEEFVASIGSDRVLELTTDALDLSAVTDRYMDHVRWDKNFDGKTIVIRDVANLTIKGLGIASSRLVVLPRYAHVLKFEECRAIRIADVTMGHEPPGYCTGGVVAASRCQDISLERCALFGSGIEGLTASAVEGLVVSDCELFDCTYGIATLASCKAVTFTRTVFRDNREFHGIAIRDSEHVEFFDCVVRSNTCRDDLFEVISSSGVRFVRGTIADNRCYGLGKIIVEGTDVQPDFVPVDKLRMRRWHK